MILALGQAVNSIRQIQNWYEYWLHTQPFTQLSHSHCNPTLCRGKFRPFPRRAAVVLNNFFLSKTWLYRQIGNYWYQTILVPNKFGTKEVWYQTSLVPSKFSTKFGSKNSLVPNLFSTKQFRFVYKNKFLTVLFSTKTSFLKG